MMKDNNENTPVTESVAPEPAIQQPEIPPVQQTPPIQPEKKADGVAESIHNEAQAYIDAEKKKEAHNPSTPVGVFAWLGLAFLMAIPVVNLVMVFKWAFSKKININKKNFAIATLIVWAVLLVIAVALGIIFPHFYEPLWNALAVLFVVG